MEEIKASMAGNVWKITVNTGDEVKPGDEVVILESMKMEIPIAAESAGTVESIVVEEGSFINEGDVLVKIQS
ncbi:acetyl-CoA carboxylase biotin carboxyl carrier protein subunit [Alkalicoccus chagannorensis]|uniref:acetyl-CoA carboxylase biotin carboxyl carrier protein subunit n=1 Tax=Alkalicoccus chagannorensis TaxID=427072 RepID=UPI0003FFC615|nr:acetyl-CoA carboxylase biotin carboxyl carrier protein subunit [Alkalicoccus chagannorensis]